MDKLEKKMEKIGKKMMKKLDKDIEFWKGQQENILDIAASSMGISREEMMELIKDFKETNQKDH